MGRTACTEPLCLYKGALYLFHFHEDKEVKNEVTKWLHVQTAEFCDIGTQKLVPRLNKCLDTVGDYVEKQLKVNVRGFFAPFC